MYLFYCYLSRKSAVIDKKRNIVQHYAMSQHAYLFLLFGFALVVFLAAYAFRRLGRGWSFQLLFKDFNRKMCMTLSLGGLFFSLYLLFVGLGTFLVHHSQIDLFSLLHRHFVEFVYGGLWLFALLSLSIYLARMVIKYFYLTKGKDS